MTDPVQVTTRRFLHGAAELLLAGPQWRASERIDLRVVAGGFATVAAPDLRFEGGTLVTPAIEVGLGGRSYDDVAAAAGIEAAGRRVLERRATGRRPRRCRRDQGVLHRREDSCHGPLTMSSPSSISSIPSAVSPY